MSTQRSAVRKDLHFYEALSMPMGRAMALPSVSDQASKFLTLALAVVVVVAVAIVARPMMWDTATATPAGSIVISGATAADAQLQPTQSVSSFQSTRDDYQVQDSSNMQAFSDSANLQGGLPVQ